MRVLFLSLILAATLAASCAVIIEPDDCVTEPHSCETGGR